MGSRARNGSERQRRVIALAGGLVLLMLASPGSAARWDWGEFEASLDSFVSVSLSLRTRSPDCRRVPNLPGAPNDPGGCTRPVANLFDTQALAEQGALINSDDATLNWKRGDVFSVLTKASHELQVDWRNFGAFVRASYFWDAIQLDRNGDSTRRTPLARDARLRSSVVEGGVVGAQFLLLDAYAYADFDLGERHFDIRIGNQVINWGESTFTQGGINATNSLDVARIRLAGSELREALVPAPIVKVGGDIGLGVSLDAYYQFGWRQTFIDPVGSFFSLNDLVGRGAEGFFLPFGLAGTTGDPGASGLSAQQLFGSGVAFGGGIARLPDREPNDQGQFGFALRYYADPIEMEVAAYYIRLHAKEPSVGFVGSGSLFVPGTIFYFREFPESIDLWGLSFNTELAGISIGGEVSYRRNEPVPIASALPDLTSSLPVGGTFRGFVREERVVAVVNGVYVVGPGTPGLGRLLELIGAQDMNLLGEIAMQSFPSLDSSRAYATPLGVRSIDKHAGSYTVRVDASYDRVFGSAVTLRPIIAFRHDFVGVGPGNGALFMEDVMQLTSQLEANYQERWKGTIGYNYGFGAGRSNPNNDRDFWSISISYAF
jgi:hypothetical protein